MPRLLPSEGNAAYPQAKQHRIVLLTRKPRRRWVYTLLALGLLAWLWPWPWLIPFFAVAGALGYLRYALWRSERVVLTDKRLVHTFGVLETTRTEATLRLDRIAGLRIEETIWGRLWGYVTIHIVAQGDHPGLNRLYRFDRGLEFYLRLRNVVFGEQRSTDPDETGTSAEYVTEELPNLSHGTRSRRR